jgi:hypothetical protein
MCIGTCALPYLLSLHQVQCHEVEGQDPSDDYLRPAVNTKIWYRKESDFWAQLGEKLRPGEGRFL